MIKQAIEKVVNHENLTFEESQAVLDEIMNGEASEVQTASLLTALTAKNPTIDEIAGAAASMRSHALAFPAVIMPTLSTSQQPVPLWLRQPALKLPSMATALLHPRVALPTYWKPLV